MCVGEGGNLKSFEMGSNGVEQGWESIICLCFCFFFLNLEIFYFSAACRCSISLKVELSTWLCLL